QDLVLGQFEVVHQNRLTIVACGVECGFIDHVRQLGAGEARCAAGQDRQIHIVRQGNLAGMDGENLFASATVRQRNHYAAIEASRAQQGGIKNVRTVGGCYQDHAFVRFKAVHLNQQLVESLLAFIVSAAQTGSAVAADSVNLIDKDDAGRILLTLLKKVAN